jgi:hypothetical protein
MSSPYTPRVRSKLSQCIAASSEPSSDNVEDLMTQSDLTMSQSTFPASQEPVNMNDAEISFQEPEDTVAASRFESSTQLGT